MVVDRFSVIFVISLVLIFQRRDRVWDVPGLAMTLLHPVPPP